MLEHVTACIDRHHLLPAQGRVVVAVSAGPDSLCLTHLLHRLCGPGKRFPDVQLQAAHLNHLLRGTASDHEAGVVAHTMQDWGIACTLGQVDVQALARREKRSLEDAARVARYRFLREVAAGQPIAVAHHADDQVETLLLHWLRGSGLAGLAGMSPRQRDIIRPLLEITRAEILAYCQDHALAPLEDQSNHDPRFLRNRIRHELLPLLQELNPAIRRTLLRNAEVARLDLAWLEAEVSASWSSVVLRAEEQTFTLDLPALCRLPLSLQHHLLRRVTALLCAGQSPLEPRHFLLLERLLHTDAGGQQRRLHLPCHLRVILQAETLSITRPATTSGPGPTLPALQVQLPIPGEVALPGLPWLARAELLAEQVVQPVRAALCQHNWPQVWQLLGSPDRFSAFIDGDTIGTHLQVRLWQPGDRMMPLGMNRHRKLQDIFVDRHIAQSTRLTIPLFCSEAHCLWAAGVCLDQRVRLTERTQRIVHLCVHPM
jgi:tRNA(Ile)-lysidine synthase